jgi:predicted RNA-binding protein YlxR (DUF448 family)
VPRRSEPVERTCIVTRQAMATDHLVRFVLAPDGTVVPDLRRRLPGRGVWVSAEHALVATAERKHLFARAFEGAARVEPGLADRVAAGLATAAIGALSLARKAGTVVSGFAKVEAALRNENAVGLVHAAEAGADGVGKLDQIARRRYGEAFPIIRRFTGEQLDLAFGGANVIHAALLAGPASFNVLDRVRLLTDFLGESARANGASGLFDDPSKASAGQQTV